MQQDSAPTAAPPGPHPRLGDQAAEWVAIEKLVPWDKNPRHNRDAVAAVAQSLERFGWGAPIVARKSDGMVVAGHTRRLAALQLGMDRVPVRWVELSDQEAAALALADNRLNELARWDDDLLREVVEDLGEAASGLGWDDAQLEALLAGLDPDAPGAGGGGLYGAADPEQHGALAATWGAPPFSVLDARQGYWQQRKREWWALGIRPEASREHLGSTVASEELDVGAQGGGSAFDPVLAELMVRWFCPPGGRVLDPFSGEATKGVVCGVLGREYVGVDMRLEQVAANEAVWHVVRHRVAPAAFPPRPVPEATAVEHGLAGFHAVDEGTGLAWAPYLEACWRSFPRYYSSPLALMASPGVYRWGVVDDCLVVLKRSQMFGNRSLYAMLPPMHLRGDKAVEARVLRWLHRQGIRAKLTQEDADAYGVQVRAQKGNVEYLYRAGDYTDEALAGRRGRNWRRALRDTGLVEPGSWVDTTAPTAVQVKAAEGVVKVWGEAQADKSPRGALSLLGALLGAQGPTTRLLVYDCPTQGMVSVTQQVGSNAVLLVRAFKLGDLAPVHDLTKAMHLADARHYLEAAGPDALMNLGAARTEGVALNKSHLRPHHALQLYDSKPDDVAVDAAWEAL